MKEKNLKKKLSLNKTTIANLSLSADEMKNAVGGTWTIITKFYSIEVSCRTHCLAGCPPEPIDA